MKKCNDELIRDYWEEEFDAYILERGYNYYLENRVSVIEQCKDKIVAIVHGNNNYQIRIDFTNNRVRDMSCTCPYARDGLNCKHMAAVLYAANAEADTATESNEPSEPVDAIEDIIAAMSEADVRALLLEEAQRNFSLCRYIQSFYSRNGIDVADLKRAIAAVKTEYEDCYGYIDYHHAADYARDLEELMEQYIGSAIRNHDYEIAFELVRYIFHSLDNLAIDDSGGEITMLADTCLAYWEEIVKNCSLDEQWKFFNWFKDHLDNYVVDYLQSYIDDFFIGNFQEPEMLRQKLDILDCLIAKANTEDDASFLRYDLEKYVSARLYAMDKLHLSQDEFDDYCHRYYHLPAVRQIILAQLREKGETEKVIKLLKDSKQIDSKRPGLTAEASAQLIEIYRETNQAQLYYQELEWYIFHHRQKDLTYVNLLKQLCSKNEWKKKLEELLSTSTLCGVKNELMLQEEMHERLLANIRESLLHYNGHAISTLNQYESILATKNPEAVRDLYADFVRTNSEFSSGRQQYQMLAHYLHKIEQYPLGREIVERIVAEWKTTYARRRAMMEELERAGF